MNEEAAMTRESARKWLEAYAKAWRERDAEGAARLFTPDAVYRSSPFRDPHVGTDGVREYWTRATRDQRNLDLKLGAPIVEGDKVAVEWWAVMDLEGSPAGTLPGSLYLIFAPDGRCRELREYWHWREERVPPPPGWGL
jgi:ketosteroid isomerase-like protein